ncbi:sugar phosphate isomerase/epimerase family protein [Acetonema longum]|uniref:Xylose isomerase-like TIM barrel n=1 Tax=Acetonema longum DSM 6540 TaxID=1009370 RepID=F7NDY1_9FIRM|nr:sugar phosphate isomerase/epimerase [Acetonema longum]EGO65735.1 xylose isomerase-like TIM barrel [Acetonema longum DSM 6540]
MSRIYISTNLYSPSQMHRIFTLMEQIGDRTVGIELFPEWQSEVFCRELEGYMPQFSHYPISLHGPYYCTEHSAAAGTPDYERSMAYFRRTFGLSERLSSRYIVFHHNNCRVEPQKRQEMIDTAAQNLAQLRYEARLCGARLAVENAGVLASGNMLFDETQFIDMAAAIPDGILLDVGHAHANGWDIPRVIRKLADKIIAYHLHNNDGREDQHNRIHDGTLDMAQVLTCCGQFTPQADLVIEYGKQCAGDIAGIAADVSYIRSIIDRSAA